MFLPRDVFWDGCFSICSAFSNGAFENLSRTTMLIKALELNFKTNLGVCVCVGMSRLSVCKTTPVQHALPLHGWTKTRRLRAVTVSFDRHCSLCKVYLVWTCLPLHGWTKKRRLRAVTVSLYMGCSLCQIYLLNHGNCGHCLDTSIVCRAHAPEPIQCDIPGHVRGFHTWRLRTTTIDFSLPLHASTKTRRLRAATAFLF